MTIPFTVRELRPAFAPLAAALAERYGTDPDDLEQEVWLRLLERAAAGRLPRDLPSWARALTVQLSRPPEPVGLPTRATVPSAEDQVLAEDRRRTVRRALAVLPGRCPELLAALVESPELSYRQLADRLGVPRGSIGPTRSRCLACLRPLLYGLRGE